jgi:hypothetical protein
VRSRIRSRSNSANAPKTWKTKRPPGVVVATCSLQAAKADAAVFERADGVDQVPQAAPEPIELPHHQRVAGPQVVEGAGEFGPLRDRAARLLAEHALAARGLQRVELQRGVLLGR